MSATLLEHAELFDLHRLGVANPYRRRYDNFIGGEWVPPVNGQYFPNVSPVIGQPFTEVARSSAEDIELALDAAHAAREAWGRTSTTQRANILNRIADRMEAKLDVLALAETIDNGKADPRDDRGRHPARDRPLPLLRRRDPRTRRRPQRDRS
jgi:hypothetical protein